MGIATLSSWTKYVDGCSAEPTHAMANAAKSKLNSQKMHRDKECEIICISQKLKDKKHFPIANLLGGPLPGQSSVYTSTKKLVYQSIRQLKSYHQAHHDGTSRTLPFGERQSTLQSIWFPVLVQRHRTRANCKVIPCSEPPNSERHSKSTPSDKQSKMIGIGWLIIIIRMVHSDNYPVRVIIWPHRFSALQASELSCNQAHAIKTFVPAHFP